MISECTENGDNSAQESVAMVGAKCAICEVLVKFVLIHQICN